MGDVITDFVVAKPCDALRPYIDEYTGYRMLGHEPGVHRGLPGRRLTFIVSLGAPIDVTTQTDPRQRPDRYDVVIGGLQASAAAITHDGDQEGIQIELTPWGSRALFGLPARAMWNTSLHGHEVLGSLASELRERLLDASGWLARFAVCDELLSRLVVQTQVAPELRETWRLLVRSQGLVPIGDIASEVGWSRRHLAARFGDEFGLSPKLAARIIRFERARLLLQSPNRPPLADIAEQCGYYDQPHFNRDFVELAGCAPGVFVAEELPSVQDNAIDVSASSMA